MPTIKLKSSDGEVFDTDVSIAICSGTIKTMLEDFGMDDDDSSEVPLPKVTGKILTKILVWAEQHKDDKAPPEEDEEDKDKIRRTDNISTWDKEFLDVDQHTLIDLLSAANYLDIKGLLDVTCKTLANMIKGKTPEELRKTFNIKEVEVGPTGTEEEQK